jgi:hypothetical protein
MVNVVMASHVDRSRTAGESFGVAAPNSRFVFVLSGRV